MKRTAPVIFALAAIACAPLLLAQGNAQSPAPATQPAAQEPAPALADPTAPTQAANPAAKNNIELKPVKAELVNNLDSKKAKVGDTVVVKTDEKVIAADGTEIPKGSKLVGHVALVNPHTKDVQNSQMALLFDQAQLKNGQKVSIKSTIKAVSPAEGQGGASSPDVFSGAQAGPIGGAPGGGGAMSNGRNSGGSTPAPGVPVSSPAATQGTTSTGQGTAPVAGKVVAGSGDNAIRTTDIPNVYLASSANGAVSGTLFAANSDVHLDGGTRMVLDIAPTASH